MKITNIDVLHILDEEFPPDPRVEGEIQALINEGLKIALVAFSRDKNKGYFHLEFLCPVKKIRLNKFTYKLSALAYTLPLYHLILMPYILYCVKVTRPKFIHVHDIRIARSVKWVSEFTNIPYVLDLHENRPEIMKEYSFVNSTLGRKLISLRIWRKNELKLINAARKTIVVTEAAAEYYIKFSGVRKENFIITTNTTSAKFNDDFISTKTKANNCNLRILYIGDTSERRGILDVLKALVILKDKGIVFDILGSSSFDSVLSSFIEREQLSETVKLHGWVGQKEIHEALSIADIGISPLVRNIHHDTTIANKLSQYSLYSLPLIVSDCTSQKSLIQKYNCGFSYQAGDISSLISVLETVLIERYDLGQFKTNSRKMFTHEFNTSKAYAKLVVFYKHEIFAFKA